jgi:hypothetical protein
MLPAVRDELRQHDNAVPASDHLQVHRHRQYAAIDVRVYPVKLVVPDLQNLAWSGCAIAIRGKVELELNDRLFGKVVR